MKARIYANLIEQGVKSLEEVPSKYYEKVRQILIDDGYLEEPVEN